MIYRELGKTGIKVSEVGAGCEGLIEKDAEFIKSFVDAMEKYGVNCIDLFSPEPKLRSGLGQALVGRREKFVLQAHLCTIWKDGQYKRTRDIQEVKTGFEDQLKRLQTDYIDIGMIHYVDSIEDWDKVKNGDVMKYALELKEKGVIKHIGLSSHDPKTALAAVNSGLIDVLLFSINPFFDLQPAGKDIDSLLALESYDKHFSNMDKDRQELYETCQRLGVGITVMKAFSGGALLSAERSPAHVALTPVQCIHYALTRPSVSSVMCGAFSVKELEECVAYEDASDAEKDYAEAFSKMPKITWQGSCMYCGHCAPCPVGIDVANVTKFLDLCVPGKDVPETVREHYMALPHRASECIACGACESRCPFQVKIRENMKKAAEVFGS